MTTASRPPRRATLPAYAPLLAARHEAHRAELAAIIDELPLRRGDRVLDVPCGDGFYLPYLAGRVGETGDVTAADISSAYLDWARHVSKGAASAVRQVAADAFALPFDSGAFDLIWCAHSLISLPDPVAALREMKRATRDGGTVAVLENDGLHDLLLPWPAKLELAVHDALRAAMARRLGSAGKMYAARHLQEIFHAAGLETFDRRTYAIDRTAPLPDADRAYLRHYFDWLARQVDPYLDEAQRARLHALIDPASEEYLPASAEFEMTSLDVLMLGRVPA